MILDNSLFIDLSAFALADPNIKQIPCMNPKLNEKCLQVEFENGDIDIAELDKAFKDDDTNYVGTFKNAPDVRVFASIPYRELGFNLIHVSQEKSKNFS